MTLVVEMEESDFMYATQFYKISNNPELQASLDALPSFTACSKIGHNFTIWSGFKIEVTKISF